METERSVVSSTMHFNQNHSLANFGTQGLSLLMEFSGFELRERRAYYFLYITEACHCRCHMCEASVSHESSALCYWLVTQKALLLEYEYHLVHKI